jgi:hypothetical protein
MVSTRKCPGVAGLRKGIHHAGENSEIHDQWVDLCPAFVYSKVDDFPTLIRVFSPDYYMEVLPPGLISGSIASPFPAGNASEILSRSNFALSSVHFFTGQDGSQKGFMAAS